MSHIVFLFLSFLSILSLYYKSKLLVHISFIFPFFIPAFVESVIRLSKFIQRYIQRDYSLFLRFLICLLNKLI
ncbi:unnamed protein product [Adineta ricciae]|uniref:Uncharacterized protein n=1 Tax=Adineta ricciae TaxID=249248 RepID=A0A813PLA3_ADIRI|nr:unnamed protein product [Adineta ricciae]